MCSSDLEEHTSELQSQEEDGIRVLIVTGVQTCALPISFGPDDGSEQDASDNAARTRATMASDFRMASPTSFQNSPIPEQKRQ